LRPPLSAPLTLTFQASVRRGSDEHTIGQNLEAFCKKLEAAGIDFDVPYTIRPEIGLAIAFLTDPWCTCIELNEGLDKF